MNPESQTGRWLCLAGATLGALGLIGHIVGLDVLTTLLPGQPAMMPNTALGLLLIGCAGALRQSVFPGRVRTALLTVAALVVLGIGVGTLTQYTLDTDLHIDRLLLSPSQGTGPYPGRPSPPTAIALTLLAVEKLRHLA